MVKFCFKVVQIDSTALIDLIQAHINNFVIKDKYFFFQCSVNSMKIQYLADLNKLTGV